MTKINSKVGEKEIDGSPKVLGHFEQWYSLYPSNKAWPGAIRTSLERIEFVAFNCGFQALPVPAKNYGFAAYERFYETTSYLLEGVIVSVDRKNLSQRIRGEKWKLATPDIVLKMLAQERDEILKLANKFKLPIRVAG